MTKTTTDTDALLAAALADLEAIETPADVATVATSTAAIDTLADVDALLADLELPEPDVIETAAVTEVSESELDALESVIALEDAKAEAYDEAEAGGLETDVEPVIEGDAIAAAKEEAYVESAKTGTVADAAPTAADKPAKKVKEPAAPKARASGDIHPSAALIARLGSVDAVYSHLVFEVGDAKLSEKDLSAECDKRLKSFDALPKKVGEKAVNLVMHLAGSSSLSVYTEIALKMLFEAGELSSKALVERYMARPYSEGTSRSQAGQIMRLLKAFEIADGSASQVTLRKNSVIGQALSEIIGKAA